MKITRKQAKEYLKRFGIANIQFENTDANHNDVGHYIFFDSIMQQFAEHVLNEYKESLKKDINKRVKQLTSDNLIKFSKRVAKISELEKFKINLDRD